MLPEKQSVQNILDCFNEEGLYLLLSDNTLLTITKKAIQEQTETYWNERFRELFEEKDNDPRHYHRCDFCPIYGTGTVCDSLKMIAPFIDFVDQHKSFESVICAFHGNEKNICHLGRTDFQNALKYCVILSLTEYCEYGKMYRKYFNKVLPIGEADDMALQIYMNIYCIHNGDRKEIITVAGEMRDWICRVVRGQINRLAKVCKNDAFLNAFATVETAAELLVLRMDKYLRHDFGETA
jgi:hypothetical protein